MLSAFTLLRLESAERLGICAVRRMPRSFVVPTKNLGTPQDDTSARRGAEAARPMTEVVAVGLRRAHLANAAGQAPLAAMAGPYIEEE